MMNEYTSELDSIFKLFSQAENYIVSNIAKRGYALPVTESADILFVGINPSYPYGSMPGSFSYNVKQAVLDYKQYFGKFSEIVGFGKGNYTWTYTDLFYFRETDQNIVDELIATQEGLDFVVQQLRLTHKIIGHISPKIIVVCNSKARRFVGYDAREVTNDSYVDVWLGYKFSFNSFMGTDTISGALKESVINGHFEPLPEIPVIFTGILKYTSQVDLRRLGWHIDYILQNSIFFKDVQNAPEGTVHIAESIRTIVAHLDKVRNLKKSHIENQNFEKAAQLRRLESFVIDKLNELK
jgi:hypothetical protein